MCCIYEDDIDVTLTINCITRIVRVIKVLDDLRQAPLLFVIRRLIDLIITRMNTTEISKMTSLLTSIQTSNSRRTLRSSMQRLMNFLVIRNYEEVNEDK